MQQYFAINKNLELKQTDYHHIKDVMRMKKGDIIKIAYDNKIHTCKLKNITKIEFDVIDIEEFNNKDVFIDIAFSLIKEQKMDFLLQKCTEVGVNKLIAINTKRSIVKIEDNKISKKIDRWENIIKEASEQSFRSSMPEIEYIKSIKELALREYDLKLICSLTENTENIKKVLHNYNKYAKILLIVGPEGGFEKEEEEYLEGKGFVSVSLGDNVLRAETAPVVAISMINYELMR